MRSRVIVIGAGPAGILAAGSAAEEGAHVLLLEKNSRPARKILVTGKGRCNLTNACDVEEYIANMVGNGSFLFSAFHAFPSGEVIRFFDRLGLPTKVERGDRIFPVSDRAMDVVDALQRYLKEAGVETRYNTAVERIIVENERAARVTTRTGESFNGDAIILATGGASYPGTGSTGDGYRIAEALGHTIIPPRPALIPLEVEEHWVSRLQGLSLRNVRAVARVGGKKLGEEFGEMLFTHYGVSGPIILTLSRPVAAALERRDQDRRREQGKKEQSQPVKVSLSINLKPALSEEQFDSRLQRDLLKYSRKQFCNSLDDLLPQKMIPVFVDLSGIPPEKPVHQITREERRRLLELLVDFRLTITRTRPLREAIVTAGGVSVKEINPRTLESKLIPGLFFAGEVIDVDGNTGGFNLQTAFCTGRLAGKHAARLGSD
ncbi:MAG: NAD(P)/FAD-dependent oxidoreductase [Syntrophothermus sp.]